MGFIMKFNKIVSILSFVLLLSMGKNTFSMNTFSMRKALSYISCGRIAPSTSNLANHASQLIDSSEQSKQINKKKNAQKKVTKKSDEEFTRLEKPNFTGVNSIYNNDVTADDIKKINKMGLDLEGPLQAISPSGNFVASGWVHKKVIVYDIKKKKEICSFKYSNGICFSKDENYVASASRDDDIGGEVIVYDIKNNKQILSYKHTLEVWKTWFSQDSKKLISLDCCRQFIMHETSPKFQEDQERHERIKKQQALDLEERIKFIANELENSDNKNQESEIINSGFSIKFINGEKVDVFKCFLTN